MKRIRVTGSIASGIFAVCGLFYSCMEIPDGKGAYSDPEMWYDNGREMAVRWL